MLLRTQSAPAFLQAALQATGLRPAPLSRDELAGLAAEASEAEKRWRTLDEEREGFRNLARGVLGGIAAAETDVALLGDRHLHHGPRHTGTAG